MLFFFVIYLLLTGIQFAFYRLKEMLRERLIQCGWRDDLKEFCKDVIRRKGLEKVTIEELVAEITPKGRGEHLY